MAKVLRIFLIYFYYYICRLETRAPTRIQPKPTANGEWRSATLQPISTAVPHLLNGTGSDAPIAPPRRKRASLQFSNGRPGGFKDVFGNFTRRSSIDSALSFDRTASTKKRRNSSSDIHSDEFCDFSKDLPEKIGLKRKISKVGNKKSDRFFGENLSDCLSDTPINGSTPLAIKKDIPTAAKNQHAKDDLDTFIENNVTMVRDNNVDIALRKVENSLQSRTNPSPTTPITVQPTLKEHTLQAEVDLNASLDKKAEFLMAMLEGYNEEEMAYHKRAPVDEPLIVPKRKHGRHICDDEEKLKLKFQANEKKAEEKSHDTVDAVIKSLENVPVGAKKIEKSHAKQVNTTATPPPSPTTSNIYEHMEPIEEPIIIPRRVVRKHICDDDEHMHATLHSNRSDDLKKLDALEPIKRLPDTQSPKKPDRDFSRYRKSLDLSAIDADDAASSPEIERPIRRKDKSLSRENLPTPPPRPTKNTDSLKRDIVNKSIETASQNSSAKLPLSRPVTPPPIATHQSLHHNDSHTRHHYSLDHMHRVPVTPEMGGNERLETILKKCNSTHSFLTPDLMDQIVNKVYGFKMNWDDHDSTMYGGYDDCSSQVAPSSKLKTRKISTIRKDFAEKPIVEEIEDASPNTPSTQPMFSIGDKGITKSDKKEEPAAIQSEQTDNSITSMNSIDGTASLTSLDSEISRPSTTNSPPPDAKVIYSITKSVETSFVSKPEAPLPPQEIITPPRAIASLPVAVPLESTKIVQQITAELPLTGKHTKSPDPSVMIKRTDTILEMKPNPSKKDVVNNDLNSIICSLPAAPGNKDMTNVLEDIYSNNKSILEDFHQYLEDAHYNEEMFSALQHEEIEHPTNATPPETKLHLVIRKPQTDAKNSHADEENDADDDNTPMTPPPFYKRRHQSLFSTTITHEDDLPIIPDRRGSIVDHDQWFLKHSGVSDIGIEPTQRRGSECLTYDTRKLFPFGRRDKTFSESAEFFENVSPKVLSKSSDHVNVDGLAGDKKRDSLEHSTLLKFFDGNKKQ